MSIKWHKLPYMDPVGPHVKYVAIRDANDMPLPMNSDWPPLAYAQVHYTSPIPNVILGFRAHVHDQIWIFQVQGFNDSDDPSVPDAIGTFGYVHLWPAVKPVYRADHEFRLVADECHRADYENAVAFETFPICPFYTEMDLERVRDFYYDDVRRLRRSSTPRR